MRETGLSTQGFNQGERKMFYFKNYTSSNDTKVFIIPQLQEKKDLVL